MTPDERKLAEQGFHGWIEQPDGNFRKPGKAGPARLPARQPQPDPGLPLEPAPSRKKKSRLGPVRRYRIEFRIFAQRPYDWDNAFTKQLQDCLVEAGFLPDDNWRVLEGSVSCHQAETKEAERTEITITPL